MKEQAGEKPKRTPARQAEQYYSPHPVAASHPRLIRFTFRQQEFVFLTGSSVFSKGHVDPGTELLLSTLPLPLSGRVLDLGCGYGPIGIVVAAVSPAALVTMVDVNERAVALARANVVKNSLPAGMVEVVAADGSEFLVRVAGEGTGFDYVLTNPPIRAGKEVIFRWIEGARAALKPQGEFYLVARTSQGAKSFFAHMQQVFGPSHCALVERGGGFRVLRASRA
ncbi:MAG TPA: class I SAM-dependent methyltransferase [Firmicutes bacterium]|nr:class I SAM-dependent methyltransferase [Bacillota bacterium]